MKLITTRTLIREIAHSWQKQHPNAFSEKGNSHWSYTQRLRSGHGNSRRGGEYYRQSYLDTRAGVQ